MARKLSAHVEQNKWVTIGTLSLRILTSSNKHREDVSKKQTQNYDEEQIYLFWNVNEYVKIIIVRCYGHCFFAVSILLASWLAWVNIFSVYSNYFEIVWTCTVIVSFLVGFSFSWCVFFISQCM